MFATLEISMDDRGVANLALARPEKHNALSEQLITELTRAAKELGTDKSVRVVVLSGQGKSFCAGGDLAWMQQQMAADADTRRREAGKLAYMLQALNTMPKPLIGRVHGAAFGGGVGMACVCDVAIGVEGGKFGLTETKLGLIPATIGPYVLARMGEAMARRVFMNSRIFQAEEAVELGILARAVAPDALDAAVEAEVAPYLSCAPEAVAAAKALTRRFGPPIGETEINASIDALLGCWDGEEAPEGIAAFFEKRPAAWVVK
ncbi:crotonase/enoyl-CoA hydratase family protein [Halocynthiibacter sp. C4]|uniref:crotonase/enoyl-CoA hydratase family protein n=1 Tax=Halocynthiibacter sp. C4 TaxID=2992758 RepID=UPI00237AE7C3|nr:crotonase/enoyl-CoA hydratase family protein [Halocynthiibacter sp. C4]MDE0589250.1 crotonase/enoyl-CoA hydratase family protein [Halocynthiibacter sp. C4]